MLPDRKHLHRENGIALLSAIIIVLVVSLLGLAIGKQVINSRRNSTSYHDQTISYLRAESALAEANAVIIQNDPSRSSLLDPDSTDPAKVIVNTRAADWWQKKAEWAGSTDVTNAAGVTLKGAPTYVIEDAGLEPALDLGRPLPRRRFIKVTTKAEGNGSAQTVLQAYVAVME